MQQQQWVWGATVLLLLAGCSTNPDAEYVTSTTLREREVAAQSQSETAEPPANNSLEPSAQSLASPPADALAAPMETPAPEAAPPVADVPAAAQEEPQPNLVSAAINATEPPVDALEPENAGSRRQVQILIPEKTFKPDPKDHALRVSFDDLDLLKVLNMEPVTVDAVDKMPHWLKGLHGEKIRIRGFMYPTYEPTNIEKFILARDNQICCFGRSPKLYDLVTISMKPGKTTDYIANRPFDVSGTLRIEMISEGDEPLALYWLDNAEVFVR